MAASVAVWCCLCVTGQRRGSKGRTERGRLCTPGSNAHFLANGRVLLEEKVGVDLDVAGGDAPCHSADDLRRKEGKVERVCVFGWAKSWEIGVYECVCECVCGGSRVCRGRRQQVSRDAKTQKREKCVFVCVCVYVCVCVCVCMWWWCLGLLWEKVTEMCRG